MRRLVTPAIVLRTIVYGDSDRVVTLLTRDHGKLTAIARGARKSVKRFGAGLGLFGIGEAVVSERNSDSGAEMGTLERFDARSGFPEILQDVIKVAHGGYASELVRELSPARQPEPRVFDLLVAFLERLSHGAPRVERLRAFELALLDAVGLRPEILRCIGCDSEPEAGFFDVVRGGLICANCHHGGAGDFLLEAPVLEAFRRLQREGDDESRPLGAGENRSMRQALGAVILGHVGRPLKSLEFIHKMNQA